MLPHKTKRGQAALERLKVFDGIPPPYDKVIEVKHVEPHCVALMASSMMLTIFPYMPCLSKDSDIKIKSETCHCTVSWMCCLFLFSDMDFSSTEEAHGCSSCSEDCASEAHSQGKI